MKARAAAIDEFVFATTDTQFHRTLTSFACNAVPSDRWELLACQMTTIFGLSALGKPMLDIVEKHNTLLTLFQSGHAADMARAISDQIDVQIHKFDLVIIIARRRSEFL